VPEYGVAAQQALNSCTDVFMLQWITATDEFTAQAGQQQLLRSYHQPNRRVSGGQAPFMSQ